MAFVFLAWLRFFFYCPWRSCPPRSNNNSINGFYAVSCYTLINNGQRLSDHLRWEGVVDRRDGYLVLVFFLSFLFLLVHLYVAELFTFHDQVAGRKACIPPLLD
jgi:hypothetical protein